MPGVAVRFDDMLATLLALPSNSEAARLNLWRQIVDLAAQGRLPEHVAISPHARTLLSRLREGVPLAARAETIASLPGPAKGEAVLALLSDEPLTVLAPLLDTVVLAPEQWRNLLPLLSDEARRVLRFRPDLPAEVRTMIESSLLAIPDERTCVEMVETVEASPSEPPLPSAEGMVFSLGGQSVDEDEFRFEAGSDGAIFWISSPWRGAVIGETIAFAVPGSTHGVDGHAAGAFRQRAPFRDARLTIAGSGPLSGEWRISATPVFTVAEGRFRGYRGSARRPGPADAAPLAGGRTDGADTLRQLVHELRTPLTAIIGFAEVIEGQFLGPVAGYYRDKAGEIRQQGERLLTALEDLDLTARATGHVDPEGERSMAGLVATLLEDHKAAAARRGVGLEIGIDPEIGVPAVDADAVERMCTRMFTALMAVAQRGERIRIQLSRDVDHPSWAALAIDRPVMLIGRDEKVLLDPSYEPAVETGDEPVLGVGFALRLVRNIATASGGELVLMPDRILLKLPLAGALVSPSQVREG